MMVGGGRPKMGWAPPPPFFGYFENPEKHVNEFLCANFDVIFPHQWFKEKVLDPPLRFSTKMLSFPLSHKPGKRQVTVEL